MIYHPLQLIVCSVMAENYASRRRQAADPLIPNAPAAPMP
jgi:sodium/bile acid cotransporter 7